MKHAAGPRRELGVRTVFNILGPLCNPASVRRQALGVYDASLIPLMAEVLEMLEAEHAIVMHSEDGLDEFSVSAPTRFTEIREGRRKEGSLDPERLGLRRHPIEALSGGDAGHNAALMRGVLRGEASAFRDATLLNAGALVYVGGGAESIVEGIRLAGKAVDNGAAADILERWVRAGVRET
jgi:anthranilate phosphoribosyltransferase